MLKALLVAPALLGVVATAPPAEAAIAPPGLNARVHRDLGATGAAYVVRCEVFLMPDHLFPERYVPVTVDIDECYEEGGVTVGSSGASGAYITKAAPAVGAARGRICVRGSAEWLDLSTGFPVLKRATSALVCENR